MRGELRLRVVRQRGEARGQVRSFEDMNRGGRESDASSRERASTRSHRHAVADLGSREECRELFWPHAAGTHRHEFRVRGLLRSGASRNLVEGARCFCKLLFSFSFCLVILPDFLLLLFFLFCLGKRGRGRSRSALSRTHLARRAHMKAALLLGLVAGAAADCYLRAPTRRAARPSHAQRKRPF